MLIPEKKVLLGSYYRTHREQVNVNILKIAFIYLFFSVLWNSIFLIFDLPYSRASLYLLLLCFVAWFCLVGGKKLFAPSSYIMQHLVLTFIIFVVCCLYFGSGYREAWSFFLLVPLISAFYGDMPVLLIYSSIGLMAMSFLGALYPLVPGVYDAIDMANRVLLYVITGTFAHLMLRKVNKLYETQVNTIMESAEVSIEQVVKSFIIAVEAKDLYTFGHSERVSRYAIELAKTLSDYRSEKKIQRLRLAGLLHDIGKINIPEQILAKEGPLTVEEYELIKTHTVVGSRMVEKIDILESLKAGVLYHHEKWDGSGYPAGIKGEQIPLEARILAIADVFDALTSNRAYRKAMSVEQAYEILQKGSGTHFDPNLINKLAFIKPKWNQIYKETNDEVKEFNKITDLL
ncbi:HD-GYP domain-containing protein [Paenibacillus albiflavus]|uniref:HD-GYP domain-containing protein n=1 Tax=Paenibacillus albiflavus TaxID=2545760 RepID=A0A4R4E1Z1_9BACL|nr:HD-GYP domain-containing protein [Paenibacillus albiflavus]TCZ72857.1 HD-GYP domain-containing protein [Paenibacillus albiflavus]